MDGKNDQQGGPSLPDELAARAGMPRAEGAEHDLHDIRATAARKARDAASPLGDEARDAYDDVRGSARSAAQDASDQISDAADRASDAAEGVRDRVRGAYRDARGRASDAYDDARSWASDRYDTQRRRAADLADSGYERYNRGRAATEDFVTENPLIVGVVGLAAGLLLGALLPKTRREDEALGPWADEAREHGLRYAREATRQGRQFVERALDPDNLDAAVQRGAADRGDESYEGSERTAHRL